MICTTRPCTLEVPDRFASLPSDFDEGRHPQKLKFLKHSSLVAQCYHHSGRGLTHKTKRDVVDEQYVLIITKLLLVIRCNKCIATSS